MRSYRLQIGSNKLDELTLGLDNPSGLAIKFNVATYVESSAASIPNTIEVYNCDIKFYKNAKKYIGQNLSLFVGFDKSVFAVKAGYSSFGLKLLYSGKITAIIPNYSNYTTPSVIFVLAGSYSHNTKKFKALELNGPSLQASKIVTWLKQYAAKGISIKTDPTMLAANTLSLQTITLEAADMSEALAKLAKFNITASMNKNTLTLLYSTEAKKTIAPLAAMLGVKMIKAEELLSQPQIINVTTSQVTTYLRADVSLGSLVMLPNNLLSSLTDTSFSFANALGSDLAVFEGGIRQVTGVYHVGESRSTSPESWATSLKLINPKDAI